MGKGVADSFETDVGSAEGSHSVSNNSFLDVTPDSIPEEPMISARFAADADDMLEADELNIEFADLMRHDLAIVAYAGHSFEHGRDGDDAVDPDAVPLSFSVPQTILMSGVTGMLHSIPTPLSYSDRKFIYTHFVCHVLICCRFWCLYSLHHRGSFLFWCYSLP